MALLKKKKKNLFASLATANSGILPDALGRYHSWQGAASTLVQYIYLSLFILCFFVFFFAVASLQVLTSLGLKKKAPSPSSPPPETPSVKE